VSMLSSVQEPSDQGREAALQAPQARGARSWSVSASGLLRPSILALAIGAEMALLLIALVPQTVWAARGYPNGPIPHALYPAVAGAFYLLPTLTGALCRRWPAAVVLATAPAWLDLLVFAVAAASRTGPFYFTQQDHSVSTVGTLELFAILGALGWLARTAALAFAGRGEWGHR
jgi:hypothetical protein